MDNQYSEIVSQPIVRSVNPFDERFDADTPPSIRRLSERICRSYGINGICDPMYIANITAFELGLGDGQGHFGDPSTWTRCGRETLGPDDLIKPCIRVINHDAYCSTGR